VILIEMFEEGDKNPAAELQLSGAEW